MVYQKISKSAAQSPEKVALLPSRSVQSSPTPIAQFTHSFTQIPVHSPAVQAKLTIGSPNDRYEQEADRVAAQVIQQLQHPTSIQRQDALDETIQAKSMLQRPDSIVTGEASTQLASEINNRRGGGQSLDIGLQQSMGQAMGADFSMVRVHTDAQSDRLNRSIQAKAFTTGQDVFFRQGAYDPGSKGGQELIAHELTHVVHQNGSTRQGQVKSVEARPRVQRTEEETEIPSKAEVVANTHAFLFTNLCRLSLWKTNVVQAMKQAITTGYLKNAGVDQSLPELLGQLKDPAGKLNRGLQQKKQFAKKWKRDSAIFSDAPRNRQEANDKQRTEKAEHISGIGSLPRQLLRVNSARELNELDELDEQVPRKTRDKPDKKGATKYVALDKAVIEDFDYDVYDYEKMKTDGMAVFNDSAGINFGAGTSGTMGDLLIEGRILTSAVYQAEKKKMYKKKGLDRVGFMSSSTLKQQKKQAKADFKVGYMKEIATAAIAMIVNEGHHSLIECIVPLEKPMKLNFGSLPPEQLLVQQLMPDRIKDIFKDNLMAWAEEQIQEEGLRGAVVSRIGGYLGIENMGILS